MNEKEQIDWLISAEEKREHISLCNLHDALWKMQAEEIQLNSPHIQELIECNRIEKKLIEEYKDQEIVLCHELGFYNVGIPIKDGHKKYFEGKTKLGALRKTEKWLNKRGANDGR